MVGVRINTGVDVVELSPHHDDRGHFKAGHQPQSSDKISYAIYFHAYSNLRGSDVCIICTHWTSHHEIISPCSISLGMYRIYQYDVDLNSFHFFF